MGRGKLNMELIPNESARHTTFQKRKKGIIKKVYELSTLCDVTACVIIYGPKIGNRPVEVETWPNSPDEVRKVVHKYKDSVDRRKVVDLGDFYKTVTRKVQGQIVDARKNNVKAICGATKDDALDRMSADQLNGFMDVLNNKIQEVDSTIDSIRTEEEQRLMFDGGLSHVLGCYSPGILPNQYSSAGFVNNIADVNAIHPGYNLQPTQCVDPLNFFMPQGCYQDQMVPYGLNYQDQMVPYGLNPIAGPFGMAMPGRNNLHDSEFTFQFGR